MNARENPPLGLALPYLVKEILPLGEEKWTLSFYQEHKPVLKNERGEYYPEVLNSFLDCIQIVKANGWKAPFRTQWSLRTVPVLVGIHSGQREILLGTPRLHRELFLEESGLVDPLLKEHVRKLKSLEMLDFPTVLERTTGAFKLPNLLNPFFFSQNFEQKTKDLMEDLLQKVRDYQAGPFEKLTDFGLGLTASFVLFRVHLLKFLAVLPSLDHDEQGHKVKKIFLETLQRLEKDSREAKKKKLTGEQRPLPWPYLLACRLMRLLVNKLPTQAFTPLIRWMVKKMAKRFIAGENIAKATASLKELRSSGREATLDQLGELVVSEKEADHYTQHVLELIKGFRLHVKKGELNGAGIPCAHVSIKMSALCSDFNPTAIDETYKLVAPRLRKIFLTAKEEEVFIQVDAEHYSYRDLTFIILSRVLLETSELADFKWVGIVVQAYLRDGGGHLADVIDLAKTRGLTMAIRLVKGAYWDSETVEAEAHAFNAPQFLNKEETDLHFRQLMYKILESSPRLQLCLGSHNLADHCFARVLHQEHFPTSPIIEHQCLHMTYEGLSRSLQKMGWPVRNYVPVGDLLVGMAYLVRRIMENSSQVGILNIMRTDKKRSEFISPEKLHLQKKRKGEILWDPSERILSSEFFNVSPVRPYLQSEKLILDQTFKIFKETQLGKFIKNSFSLSGPIVEVTSPSDPKQIVGSIQFANKEDASKALDRSFENYQKGGWDQKPPHLRACTLVKVADIFLINRLHLTALMMWEAGKTWKEATGDVDEAIDFLNFYAREEMRLIAEEGRLYSRGVVAVISPWNFPCAIPCGMVAAALVAGNTVILKSAEQTPLVAQQMVDYFHQGGIPQDVLIHLPGIGEEVGAMLVEDARVSAIVFTGSRKVGQWVAHRAGKRIYENPLHRYKAPVKLITEMGGKNAIIVTGSAELDETVVGCLTSAFSHAGQKCSALSRILVDSSVKEKFLERLKDAVLDLKVGESYQYSTFVNPVITAEDKKRLQKQVQEASAEAKQLGGKVWADRSQESFSGHCVGPVVIELPKAKVLQGKTYASLELFGPVVHVIGYETLEEAIQLANSTEYALTGGIFSQSQDDIDFLLKHFQAGNLYVNRSCTGARVHVEPFGGFKLSGTGPKAGGTSYVRAFHIDPYQDKISTSWPGSRQGDGPQAPIKLVRGLGTPSRAYRTKVLEAIKNFLSNKDHFHGMNKKDIEILRNFSGWLTDNLATFIHGKHPNRRIPGLLNYNDYSMVKRQGLLVSFLDRPGVKILMDFFACLSLGCGVNILCRNSASLKDWQSLIIEFQELDIGPEFLLLADPDEKTVQQCVQNPETSFIIVDGSLQDLKGICGSLYDEQYSEKYMRSIHTPYDGPSGVDFEQILLQFVFVRSMSINTMRHGAPLDLNI